MVQVPCPYGVWFMSYGLLSNGTSLAYCCHCILVMYYTFVVKSKNKLRIAHFIIGAEIICILLFHHFSSLSQPHSLWAVIPMGVDLIGYGPLTCVAGPPSSLS